jgi:HK97 gp10 family phage protein
MNFKVEGLSDLEAAFEELPRATARNVARRALLKAGEVIAEDARQRAPDDPSTGPEDLHRSIAVSPKLLNSKGLSEFASEMAATGDRAAAAAALVSARRGSSSKGSAPVVMMFVGPAGAPARWGVLQEFGTIHHGAQPFMTPAWEAQKNNALDVVVTELKSELKKASDRLARKAAKLAKAKG